MAMLRVRMVMLVVKTANFEFLLCARYYSKSCTSTNSFTVHKNPMRQLLGSVQNMKKHKCTDTFSNSPQGNSWHMAVTGHLAPGCLVLTLAYSSSTHLHCSVWESGKPAKSPSFTLSSRISYSLVFLLWVWYHHLYPFLACKIMFRHVLFIMLISSSNNKFLFNVL